MRAYGFLCGVKAVPFKIRKRGGKWCLYQIVEFEPKPSYHCFLRDQYETWAEAMREIS
jgi:hypothetical protein